MPKIPREDKADVFAYLWRTMAPAGAPDPDREYSFTPDFDYRLDFAWPKYRVAVEIDGGNWMVRQRRDTGQYIPVGRHTKDRDMEKCNLATSLGWKIIHYSPAMLQRKPGEVVLQVARALVKQCNQGVQ